ncbi:MAG: hypothetical protein M1561_05520 [Gammaproteobacteria bacterium]|nr:hypothetical protein [Gammaproteobacteria bacterium]
MPVVAKIYNWNSLDSPASGAMGHVSIKVFDSTNPRSEIYISTTCLPPSAEKLEDFYSKRSCQTLFCSDVYNFQTDQIEEITLPALPDVNYSDFIRQLHEQRNYFNRTSTNYFTNACRHYVDHVLGMLGYHCKYDLLSIRDNYDDAQMTLLSNLKYKISEMYLELHKFIYKTNQAHNYINKATIARIEKYSKSANSELSELFWLAERNRVFDRTLEEFRDRFNNLGIELGKENDNDEFFIQCKQTNAEILRLLKAASYADVKTKPLDYNSSPIFWLSFLYTSVLCFAAFSLVLAAGSVLSLVAFGGVFILGLVNISYSLSLMLKEKSTRGNGSPYAAKRKKRAVLYGIIPDLLVTLLALVTCIYYSMPIFSEYDVTTFNMLLSNWFAPIGLMLWVALFVKKATPESLCLGWKIIIPLLALIASSFLFFSTVNFNVGIPIYLSLYFVTAVIGSLFFSQLSYGVLYNLKREALLNNSASYVDNAAYDTRPVVGLGNSLSINYNSTSCLSVSSDSSSSLFVSLLDCKQNEKNKI